MAVSLAVVRGDSLVFQVEFFTDTARTITWDEVGLFEPVLQLRLSTSSEGVVATANSTVEDNVVTFSFPSTQTQDWDTCDYYWDVQFTDPDAAPGYGEFTWPGPGEERNSIKVTKDVTRPAP